ncbi:MAG: Asp-tRNA(Asn)/Glu-tRNA(Gln) amidotransferase subunit GatA [Pseudomonadota bacterium]
MNQLHSLGLARLREGLAQRQFSATELVRHMLMRIEQHDASLNSFLTVTADAALAAAADADKRIAAGDARPLEGLPIAHKDIFCTEGVRTSCGSRMLENFIPPYDATVVSRLATAGAIVLGKTNMDEFAMGSSNETSYYGDVRNPWALDCSPGGSSGGSAAAVAARLACAATGTDTGGSIRQPAALCGLTGMKPTYGRVSRYGMIAFASSLDQAGTLTTSAEDSAHLLNAMAGFDPHDSTSVDAPVDDYVAALAQPLKGVKLGVVREFMGDGLDSSNAIAVREALTVLESLGASVREISLPNIGLSVPTYYVVAPAECSSNLSRFDGVRFGHRAEDAVDLADLYKRSRSEGFGDEVKRRIMTGTYVLSAGYYDAYYLKAQKVRRLISADFTAAFADVDLIVGPTTPTPAFKLGEKTDDPITMYLNDIYTIGVNLAGLPALSMPCGMVGGMPVGLQVIAPAFGEGAMLNCAHQYQQNTDWHSKCAGAYQ